MLCFDLGGLSRVARIFANLVRMALKTKGLLFEMCSKKDYIAGNPQY